VVDGIKQGSPCYFFLAKEILMTDELYPIYYIKSNYKLYPEFFTAVDDAYNKAHELNQTSSSHWSVYCITDKESGFDILIDAENIQYYR
jgi:hypothetical protein